MKKQSNRIFSQRKGDDDLGFAAHAAEAAERWTLLAAETRELLRQADELMEHRADLCRRRNDLLRDLLHAARAFVEESRAKK